MHRSAKLLGVFLVNAALVTAALATGCGGPRDIATSTPADRTGNAMPSTNAPDAASSGHPTSGTLKIPANELPIGDYLPPLDDDRVEIAKPQDWHALPRDSAFLTRFYATTRNGLPRIEVTVEPRMYGDLTNVTPKNVEQFVSLVSAELGDLELIEHVIPLQIGENACARYVGRVELKLSASQTIDAERQRILVLRDGRLYTIDLLVLPNTLRQSRDAAYAVCASLRFASNDDVSTAAGLPLPE